MRRRRRVIGFSAIGANNFSMDSLFVFFLAQGEQPADSVMERLTTFIRGATRTLDFAVYDMRFSDPLKDALSAALRERANAGVQIRICFDGQPATARVMFSPGFGHEIDSEIARRVREAKRRVRICSLLINSGTLISELGNLLERGQVKVDGIYDRTQMEDVYRQWQEVPSNHWKIPALKNIILRAGLAGKNSTPYTPTSKHDFMHNKVLVIDDTVITGSYNFSRSAQFNAENILFIESAPLAQTYSRYIDHLKAKYRS